MLRAIAVGLAGCLIGGVIDRVARGEAGSRSPPDHGGPFCNSDHREGNLTRSRYHRLSVVQRFNVLCDRSQIRI